jgi:hypothetical protein
MRRIMSREAYEQGRCRQSAQDGSREFITLLACVSALGKTIPPTLLYKGRSGDLQSTWVEDLGAEDDLFFGATENGWTNDKYGMMWLQEVFEPRTRPSRITTKRLLIVDGHSSHVNLRFIEWASTHGIIILILPPHATHRLQPLDVSCFQPLATKYQVHLDLWLSRSLGQTSMSKRTFYQIFRPSWLESFTPSNIQGAFEKAGIWPFSPPIVLDAIARRPVTPPDAQDGPSKPPPTPMTSKSIRRAQKTYKANPTQENLDVIFRSQERLAAQHEVDKHLQSGLQETLKNEKKRRQRGKRLNLLGEEDSGAQLFHSSRVRAALAYEAEKEARVAAEKVEKEVKKAQAAENKQRREAEAREKTLQRQIEKEAKARAKAEKLAEKEARKRQPKQPKENEKKSLIVVLRYKKTSNSSTQAVSVDGGVEEVGEVGGAKTTRTRTRRINLPERFRN